MTVSVLMTAYNREKYIGESIKSVLASSYTDLELIIVDDRSKDNTLEIAHEWAGKDKRIRVYVNESNLGDYPNRNRAASYATGKYIKYLDADDKLFEKGLETMVVNTEVFPDAGFGLSAGLNEKEVYPVLVDPKHIYQEHFGGLGHFDRAPGSALIKREVFNQLGGFSGKRMIGDFEFWLKISRYYSMVKLPFDTYWNRLHDQQESGSSYARKNYSRLRKEVLLEALRHPDCPLPKKEIRDLLNKARIQSGKEKIKSILRYPLSGLKK